jgi:hypothetical protein
MDMLLKVQVKQRQNSLVTILAPTVRGMHTLDVSIEDLVEITRPAEPLKRGDMVALRKNSIATLLYIDDKWAVFSCDGEYPVTAPLVVSIEDLVEITQPGKPLKRGDRVMLQGWF